MFEPLTEYQPARVAVLGVGGGGCNAINHMIKSGLRGVDFYAINTDAQALATNLAPNKVQIGKKLTGGLGSGGNPTIGRKACEESIEELEDLINSNGYDMVFIATGEGGGTGTGASPLIAEVAKRQGALTVAVATKPFDFEGPLRRNQAISGINELRQKADTLIVIPNQRLISIVAKDIPFRKAFALVDEVLCNAVRGIADVITTIGLINVDFADVRTVMSERGQAIMGIGMGQGENRAIEAANNAVSSPLIEDLSLSSAKAVLLNITGGEDLTFHQVNEAATAIIHSITGEANIIFGAVIDPTLNDTIKVTVIATGIEEPLPKIPEAYDLAQPEIETPTFKRREYAHQTYDVQKIRSISKDDLEIPTFLRRQLD